MASYNTARLKDCFRRAAAGGELTLGFFGGSIAQGSLATKPENCYAYRVYRWWCETFPQATFHYVNGGIGGTSSHYGGSPCGGRPADVPAGLCGGGFQRE